MSDDQTFDEELARAYRAGLGSAEATRADCPSPEILQELVDAEGDREARLPLLEHVLACARCLPEFELLRSIHAAEQAVGAQEVDATGDTPIRRRWTAAPWQLAMAASLLGVIAVGALTQFRSGAESGVVRGSAPAVTAVQPVGEGPLPAEFVWTAAGGEAVYELELLDRTGAVVFRQSTTDTVVAFPVDAVSNGEEYRWLLTVTTLERGQERLAPVVFSIR